MRLRRALALILTASVLAACGTEAPSADARFLAYGYQPGTDLTYQMHQEMSMDMESSGAAALAMGAGDLSMSMVLDQRLGYAVAEGRAPETLAISVTYEMTDGSAVMTVDGLDQFLSFDQIASDVASPPVDLVVDARGDVVEMRVGGEAMPSEFLDMLGGAGSAGMFQQPHLGPVFPDHPVGIGDSWTVEGSQTVLGVEIEQRGEYRVVAEEPIDGVPTLRIAGTITTQPMEIDLAELMEAVAGSGLAGDPQLDEGLDAFGGLGIDMSYRIERTEMVMTAWFDPVAGIVLRAEIETPVEMSMRMSGLPGAAGDVSLRYVMEMVQAIDLIR